MPASEYPASELLALSNRLHQLAESGQHPAQMQEGVIGDTMIALADQADPISATVAGDLRRMGGGLQGRARLAPDRWSPMSVGGIRAAGDMLAGMSAALQMRGAAMPDTTRSAAVLALDLAARKAVQILPVPRNYLPTFGGGGDAA